MLHKYAVVLAGVVVAVLLSQPSTAWAQAVGPDLVISMSHRGNFTVGVPGDYTIVVSNIGRTASTGGIEVDPDFLGGPASWPTTGIWSCISIILSVHFPPLVKCFTSSVIAPGASASPLTLSFTPSVSGTLMNAVSVGGGGDTVLTNNSATDPTIVVAAVPTLPEWAMILLVGLLAFAGYAALGRPTTGPPITQ